MNNKLLKFCYVLVFFSGLMGMMFFSTVIHEYSHMRDFRNTNITLVDEKIVINVPLEWNMALWDTEGVYSKKIDAEDYDSAHEQTKYTELKAYSVSIFLLVLFILSFIFIMYKMEGYRTFRYFDEQSIMSNPIH